MGERAVGDRARKDFVINNFARVLHRLPLLHSLTWTWLPPALDSPLWGAIAAQSSLRRLSFNITLFPGYHTSMTQVSNVISVLLRTLDSCPTLEDLTITIPGLWKLHQGLLRPANQQCIRGNGTQTTPIRPPPRPVGWSDEYLLKLQLPLLRRFNISHLALSTETGQHFADFLSRQEWLEYLRITNSTFRPSVFCRPDLRLTRLSHLDLDLEDYPELAKDMLAALPHLPGLRHLSLWDECALDVLVAARPLKSTMTGRLFNPGPVGQWRDVMFPISHMYNLVSWGQYFHAATALHTIVLHCAGSIDLNKPIVAGHPHKTEELHPRGVSLIDVFAKLAPDVEQVDTEVKEEVKGRETLLQLCITCHREDANLS